MHICPRLHEESGLLIVIIAKQIYLVVLVLDFVFLNLTIWRMTSAVWQWRQFFSYSFRCWRKELSDFIKGVLIQYLRRLVYHCWREFVYISGRRLLVLRRCWGSNRCCVATRLITMFWEIKSFTKLIRVSGEWRCGSSLRHHLSVQMLWLVKVWVLLLLVKVSVRAKYLRVVVVRVHWQSSAWAVVLLF